jgi:hypothetical protein
METNRYEYVNEAFVVDRDVYEKDFQQWLSKKTDLPMPKAELDEYLETQRKRREERMAASKKENTPPPAAPTPPANKNNQRNQRNR